jgi:V8-like Glu-specific endopeptidase
VVVCGYPGDYCGHARLDPARGCAKENHATVQFVHDGSASFRPGLTGILLHTADTHRGQSGSPVWIKFTDGSQYLVGVHVDAHRVYDASTGRQLPVAANRAVHLTSDVIQLVRGWMP